RGARTENLQSAGEVFRVPIWLGRGLGGGAGVGAAWAMGCGTGVSWLAIFAPIGAVWWAWRRRGG
ncbi:hypothetical protein CTI14_55940, partial [Methylobacterium radiotolerans]